MECFLFYWNSFYRFYVTWNQTVYSFFWHTRYICVRRGIAYPKFATKQHFATVPNSAALLILTCSFQLLYTARIKRHRLAASCRFYRLVASRQQVAASLLNSLSCSKSVKIRLVANWYLQTCYKLMKQITCSRLVIIRPEQAMRTHPDISLMTAR